MSEINPLLNSVVLRRIFELIPFEKKEFQNFRLVSTAWFEETLSIWRDNVQIRVLDKGEIEQDNESIISQEAGISVDEYLGLLENDRLGLTQYPFRRYSMKTWSIHLDGDLQATFWNRVGPHISQLNIENSHFHRIEDMRRMIFQLTPKLKSLCLYQNTYGTPRPQARAQRLNVKLPQHNLQEKKVQKNLVELKIELLQSYEPEVNLSISWMELFLHFPNIKKLELKVGLTQPIAELREIFESIEILRREYGPKYLANLCDLDIMQDMRGRPEATLLSLSRLQFPLKRLALNIGSFTRAQVFKQLLESCQKSLEHLNIIRGSPPPNDLAPIPNFPFGLKLPNLKELCLAGPVVRNLMFLKDFPNLELFEYSPPNEARFDDNLTELLRRTKPVLKSLKTLRINGDGCSAAEIRKLWEIMPNVTSLKIGLENGGFKTICQNWRNLEYLEIVPFRVGEEGLLGRDEKNKENFSLPNITDLKELKTFKMGGNHQGLTEEAVFKGIMLLPNLESVTLTLSTKISEPLQTQFVSKFPLSSISVLHLDV